MVKLVRMIRHRWWIVVIGALALAALSVVATSVLTSRIRPQFEATTAIVVDSSGGGQSQRQSPNVSASGEEEETLETALVRAFAANASALDSGLGHITSEPRLDQLRFNARGRDEASVVELAEQMRILYIQATLEEAVDRRETRLDEIVTEASDILALIQLSEESEPTVPEISSDVQARLDLLLSLETALLSQQTKLSVDLVLAEAGDDRVGDPEDIQTELGFVAAELNEVSSELSALSRLYGLSRAANGTLVASVESQPTPRPSDGSEADATADRLSDVWTLAALEARYAALSAEFEELFLNPEDPEVPVLEEVVVSDLTPNFGAPLINGALGIAVGILLAMGLIVGESTLRATIRDESDLLPIPAFAELPNLVTIEAATMRRQEKLLDRRARGIQRLRNFVAPSLDDRKMRVIGITGVSVASQEVRGIAEELADRLAAADRTVTVLGVDFGDSWPASSDDDLDVASLWAAIRSDSEAGIADLKSALALQPEHTARLIPPGTLPGDSTDVGHTAAFGSLLDICQEDSDIVLAVLANSSEAATHSFLHRVDGVVLACAAHVSTRKQVKEFLTAAAPSGARVLGAVLLLGSSQSWASRRESWSEFMRTRMRRDEILGDNVGPPPVEIPDNERVDSERMPPEFEEPERDNSAELDSTVVEGESGVLIPGEAAGATVSDRPEAKKRSRRGAPPVLPESDSSIPTPPVSGERGRTNTDLAVVSSPNPSGEQAVVDPTEKPTAGRVKRALNRFERALEPLIAPPDSDPPPYQTSRPPSK